MFISMSTQNMDDFIGKARGMGGVVGCPHSTRPPYILIFSQVFLEKTTGYYVSFPEPCDVWSPPLSACRLESMYVGPTTLAYLFCFD